MTITVDAVIRAPHGDMDPSEMKNQLSLAFIGMVAATAGFDIQDPRSDFNGVDLSLRSYLEYPDSLGSSIDVQLKCTSQKALQREDFISYSLDRDVYTKLSHKKRYSLGMLAVLVVPELSDTWMHQDEERLFARSCMYYSPASEWDEMAEGADSKTVRCARSNILTVDAMSELLRLSSTMGAFR